MEQKEQEIRADVSQAEIACLFAEYRRINPSSLWSQAVNKIIAQSDDTFNITRKGIVRYLRACQKVGTLPEVSAFLEMIDDAGRGLSVAEIVNNDQLMFRGIKQFQKKGGSYREAQKAATN